jgi:hypothetical protein
MLDRVQGEVAEKLMCWFHPFRCELQRSLNAEWRAPMDNDWPYGKVNDF